MSSTTSASEQPYADCDEFIDYQINLARNRIRWTDLLSAMVLTGILLFGYLLIFTVLDHWIVSGGFSPVTRAVMLGIVLAVSVAIVVRYVVMPWSRSIHPLFAARVLDKSDTGLDGALLSLIDLKAGNREAPEGIQETLEKRAAVKLSSINVDEAIDRNWLLRMGITLFVLVVATCLYAVFSPKAISLLRPLTFSNTGVATTTRILQVQPGNIQIAAGEQLEIIADIEGKIPEQVLVLFTTEDNRLVDEQLVMLSENDDGRFRVLMVGEEDRGIRQNLAYHIVAGDAASDFYKVLVDQPPTAAVVRVDYRYPEYMALVPRSSDTAQIEAWEGSTVTVHAESSVPVATAILELADDPSFSTPAEQIPMDIQDLELTCSLTLQKRDDGSFPKFYRIIVSDKEDRTDPMPTVYSLNVREDQAPVVELLDPIRDLKVPANAIVPLLIEARDPDFLLRSVTLNYEVNGAPIEPGDLIFDALRTGLQKTWVGTHDFSIERLGVKPGDVIRYYVSARDNQPPLGNQGRTATMQLQILAPASEEEIKEQLEQDREIQEQKLQDRIRLQQKDPAASDPKHEEPIESDDEPGDSGSDPDEQTPESENSGAGTRVNDATGDRPDGTNSQAGDNTNTENSVEAETGNEQSGQPARDDEALQKLLEKYQAEAAENTTDDGSPSPDSDGSSNAGASSEGTGTETTERGNASNQETTETGTTDSTDSTTNDSTESLSGPGDNREQNQSEGTSGSNGGSLQNTNQQPTDSQTDPSPGELPNSQKTGDTTNTDPGQQAEGSESSQNANQQGTGTEQNNQTGESSSDPAAQPGNEGDPDENANMTEGNPENANPQDSNQTDAQQQESQQEGGGSQGGGSQGGGSQGGGSQGGGSQGGGSQGGGSQGGGSQGGGSQGGGSQGGGSQGGGSQGGGSQGGGSQGGGSQGGGSQGGGSQGGGSQGGGSQGGGSQGGGSQGGGSQGGGSQGGGSQGGGSQGGGSQGGGSQGGGSQGGGSQGGGSQGGGSQGGGSQGGGSQGGGSQGGGSQGGGSQGGGSQGGGSQGGGSQGGGSQGGGSQGGGSQGGGSQGGGSQGGGSQGGGSQGGGSQGGGSQGGGSQGGGSQGGGSQGGGSQGGGSQGGGSQGGGSQGGGSQGGGSQGGGSQGGGSQGGGSQGGGSQGGGSQGGGSPQNQNAVGGGGQGQADQPPNSNGQGTGGGSPERASDPNLEDAAQAASMALRRLKQDLERGKVDQEMLEELGWTEDELRSFSDRLERQLKDLNTGENESTAERLQRRRMEEMLKSMNLKTRSTQRSSDDSRDRELQDTEVRKSTPPPRLRDKYRNYQRSVLKDDK